jgi:hypothetical protein
MMTEKESGLLWREASPQGRLLADSRRDSVLPMRQPDEKAATLLSHRCQRCVIAAA